MTLAWPCLNRDINHDLKIVLDLDFDLDRSKLDIFKVIQGQEVRRGADQCQADIEHVAGRTYLWRHRRRRRQDLDAVVMKWRHDDVIQLIGNVTVAHIYNNY